MISKVNCLSDYLWVIYGVGSGNYYTLLSSMMMMVVAVLLLLVHDSMSVLVHSSLRLCWCDVVVSALLLLLLLSQTKMLAFSHVMWMNEYFCSCHIFMLLSWIYDHQIDFEKIVVGWWVLIRFESNRLEIWIFSFFDDLLILSKLHRKLLFKLLLTFYVNFVLRRKWQVVWYFLFSYVSFMWFSLFHLIGDH